MCPIRHSTRALLALLLIVMAWPAAAQTATPTPVNLSATITFPPPVYVLAGEVEVAGTANLPNQQFYFLEYQPLGDDLTPRDGERTLWFPATLPAQDAVSDDVLGIWDTATTPDGLYALRLTINLTSGNPVHAAVAPIRIDNSAQTGTVQLDEDDDINNALLALTATAESRASAQPVGTVAPSGSSGLQPTPTAFMDGTLTAEVITLANLRQGDSTLFAIESGLNPGTMLTVLGRSSRGNNWLLVEMADGTRGWVAPSVVTLSGNIIAAPEMPAPVPPVTPTPTAPPIPNLSDAVVTRVEVDRELKQGEAFQIIITLQNIGLQYQQESALFCNVEPMNVSVSTVAGNLQPGATTQVAIPLRLDSGGDSDINIICKIDMNDELDEINESNNTNNFRVRLNS